MRVNNRAEEAPSKFRTRQSMMFFDQHFCKENNSPVRWKVSARQRKVCDIVMGQTGVETTILPSRVPFHSLATDSLAGLEFSFISFPSDVQLHFTWNEVLTGIWRPALGHAHTHTHFQKGQQEWWVPAKAAESCARPSESPAGLVSGGAKAPLPNQQAPPEGGRLSHDLYLAGPRDLPGSHVSLAMRGFFENLHGGSRVCLLYTSPSPRD